MIFTGLVTLITMYLLHASCKVPAPDLATIFERLDFSDVWAEGRMSEVCRYLRRNRSLAMPDEWRCRIPKTIPF